LSKSILTDFFHTILLQVGFIIRDWMSKLIKVGAAHYGESSVLEAKARALRDGLKEVANVGFIQFLIEGDNAIVI